MAMGTGTGGRMRCAMLALLCIYYLLAGCSNGRGSVAESGEAQEPPPPTQTPSSFEVRGSVSGLAGSGLVLQLNGANDRAISSNGAFSFSTTLANQTSYVVTVSQQPANPAQTCTPQNASGVINGAHVTNVSIVCSTQSFSVGGTVTGLQGSGLILRRNGEESLPIASNGAFTFATPQASGTTYEVTVAAQPANPTQTCTVANGSGTVGSGDARSVSVSCATNSYAISGRVAGLAAGSKVVLRNSGDLVEVQADGAFTFPTKVASGGSYDVKVETHPANPPQSCSVANGKGTVTNADVTNVEVSCKISEFKIGGTVSGFAGTTALKLQNNGTDDLTITQDGAFTFATAVQTGRPYNVTVATQPTGPLQECTVQNPSGVVGVADVKNIQVRCVTIEFTVGGTVSGLAGSGLQLQNNASDTLAVAANGGFKFNTSVRTGSPYAVTVAAQPTNPWQECTVTNGAGTVTGNVGNVQVNCVTLKFPISITVSGLQGFNLQVTNNGVEQLSIHSNGTYEFPTPIESGKTYNIVVTRQPTVIFRPPQTCTVDGGSAGTVGGSRVTVPITCN